MVNCEFRVCGESEETIFITSTMHLPTKNDFVRINEVKYKILQVEFNYETKQNFLDCIVFYIEKQ